jgi:YbgC/YbaW family acyl-CoA thioester hydrolase
MRRSHETSIKVRWGETDPMGIVFYPTYFAWFDEGTHELFASSGRTLLEWLRDDGVSVPIAECGASFRAPVFADDRLVVRSTVGEIGPQSLRVEHLVKRGRQTVATGFEQRVVARMDDEHRLQVTHMPDELRSWLEAADPIAMTENERPT